MSALNRWLIRHFWVQLALSVAAATAVLLLLHATHPGSGWGLYGIPGAIGTGVVLYSQRRRQKELVGGTTEGLVRVEEALVREEVPDEPRERAALSRVVEQRLEATRRRPVALVLLYAMFGVIFAVIALDGGGPSLIVYGLIFAGALFWITWAGGRQRRRLERMGSALGLREGAREDAREGRTA
ncbi:hypothetical protein [Streptomyces lichenis]|uniref:Uncharacterized protein n=1 Tax=Streptomyces lichenis TaxID=2306967 RepID=A0ABT0I8M6_9ACTN|nr:hypothetical protein [Streptomyces lichenis]MCK8677676.1 hypothetical protein [Streptomyces lichenis]